MPKKHSTKIAPQQVWEEDDFDEQDIPQFPDPSKEVILGGITHTSEYVVGGDIGTHSSKSTYTKADDGYHEYIEEHDSHADVDVPYKCNVSKEEVFSAFASAKSSKEEYTDVHGSIDQIMLDGVECDIKDKKFEKALHEYIANTKTATVDSDLGISSIPSNGDGYDM